LEKKNKEKEKRRKERSGTRRSDTLASLFQSLETTPHGHKNQYGE